MRTNNLATKQKKRKITNIKTDKHEIAKKCCVYLLGWGGIALVTPLPPSHPPAWPLLPGIHRREKSIDPTD